MIPFQHARESTEKLKNELRLAHQENLRLKRQQIEATIRANNLREENERLRKVILENNNDKRK